MVDGKGYLISTEGIEAPEGVADEGNLQMIGGIITCLSCLSTERRTRVVLIDLVDGEILSIDVGTEFGFKRRADAAQAIPLHTAEEWVLLDFAGAPNATQSMFGITDQTRTGSELSRLSGRTSSVLTA